MINSTIAVENAAVYEHRWIEGGDLTGVYTLLLQAVTGFPRILGPGRYREILKVRVEQASALAVDTRVVFTDADDRGEEFLRLSVLEDGVEHEHPAGTVGHYMVGRGHRLREELSGAPELGGHSSYLLYQDRNPEPESAEAHPVTWQVDSAVYGIYQGYDTQTNRVVILDQPMPHTGKWTERTVHPADVLCILT